MYIHQLLYYGLLLISEAFWYPHNNYFVNLGSYFACVSLNLSFLFDRCDGWTLKSSQHQFQHQLVLWLPSKIKVCVRGIKVISYPWVHLALFIILKLDTSFILTVTHCCDTMFRKCCLNSWTSQPNHNKLMSHKLLKCTCR